jgi:substrate import-associated zinc metallohydrolase lipoprotein
MKKNMKKYLLLAFVVTALISFNSCSKRDNDLNAPIEGLGGVRYQKTALDIELYENFTKPYNIEVIYRWDAGLMGYTTVLVPAEENKVLPVMNILKKGWIAPFEEIAGLLFVKKYIPKQYVLIGSYAYATNGNIVLGSADQGLKVNIFGINQINLKSAGGISQILGTVHHELAHMLHQNIMYPSDFELVSAGSYDSNGLSISQANARKAGFITGYGMTSPNEDFATLVATMLSNSKAEFDAMLDAIPEDSPGVNIGKTRLKEKENIIITYFLQAWNIDFRALQRKTAEARAALIN